jgi:beta-glucosidase
MLLAHALTYRKIKEQLPDTLVGFNRHLRVFDPHRPENKRDITVAGRQAKIFNWDQLDALYDGKSHGFIKVSRKDADIIAGSYDFIGLNYYARDQVMFSPANPFQLFGKTIVPPGAETSHQGEGEYYPHGICRLLTELGRYEKPLYVTENGVATEDDAYRVKYMAQHIAEVGRAIQNGSDIRGYYFWSTLDNFEWAEGYSMRFGMVHVDFDTQERTVKPSGKMFGDIAKNNRIDHSLVTSYGATL